MPAPDIPPESFIADLIARMQALGDPTRAAGEKAYMKSPRSFYGVRKADIDRLARQFRQAFKQLPPDDTIPHIDTLWRSDNFDEVTLGVCIAREFARSFRPEHLEQPFGGWFDTCEGWAHCDELATRSAGIVVRDYPEESIPVIHAWRLRPALWTRRASILCHLPAIRSRSADLHTFFSTCEALLDEKEFFIRKAIGWALRELSKEHADEAFAFMMQHRDRAARLVLREGCRLLPKDLQAHILG
jgi:3-methyladenine DNA glycosylase AlkD